MLASSLGVALTVAEKRFPLNNFDIAICKAGGRSSRMQFRIIDRMNGETVGLIYNSLHGPAGYAWERLHGGPVQQGAEDRGREVSRQAS